MDWGSWFTMGGMGAMSGQRTPLPAWCCSDRAMRLPCANRRLAEEGQEVMDWGSWFTMGGHGSHGGYVWSAYAIAGVLLLRPCHAIAMRQQAAG